MSEKKESNQLMVWWIPQLGINKTFNVRVKSLEEAHLLLDVLAEYDLFQHKNKVKPDYCNAGGLQEFVTDPDCFDEETDKDKIVVDDITGERGIWLDWYNSDGEEFDDWRKQNLPQTIIER